jgi:dolichol-phosphate mannosyltransferase
MIRLMTANLGMEVRPFPYTPLAPSKLLEEGGLFDDLDRAFDLLVATSRHPLRWFSRLGVMAAFLNVLYALYVVGIYCFKARVAEGWVTLSMQQAVMFFFLFLVAAVLCEYVGKILVESQDRPLYTVLEERNSSVLVDAAKRRNIVAESPRENPS